MILCTCEHYLIYNRGNSDVKNYGLHENKENYTETELFFTIYSIWLVASKEGLLNITFSMKLTIRIKRSALVENYTTHYTSWYRQLVDSQKFEEALFLCERTSDAISRVTY